MSQCARGWMEAGPSHQGLMQSDCCKPIFSLALTREERGCSCLQQQLSEQALSNADPWGSWLATFVNRQLRPAWSEAASVRSAPTGGPLIIVCLFGLCLKAKDSLKGKEWTGVSHWWALQKERVL